MSNANEPCSHCQNIRVVGESWIIALNFMQWSAKDVAQLCAYIHARIRFKGLSEVGAASEQEFLDWFKRICDLEFQELQYANPIEPKSFDETFDFRKHMNGE